MELTLSSGETEEPLNIFSFFGFEEFFGVSDIVADLEAELVAEAELGGGSNRRGVVTRNDDPFLTGGVVTTLSKRLKITIQWQELF